MAGRLASVVALAALVLGTDVIHARIPPVSNVDRGEAFVPDPALAKLMALGFDSVVADYYWLQAIQAIGGEAVITAELGAHLGKLVDVTTTLDPWVDHPYRFAAVWLTESEDDVRTANRLLRRGIEHHPDEWRNRFYLGFNHFFYLMENDEAADVLWEASQLPGAPPYLERLVARLRSHTADIDVAEVFLRDLLRRSNDDVIRAGYLSALDEIEVEKKARFLDRAREAFIKLNGRDIMAVEELVSGPNPILRALPSPEPDALPASMTRDSVWELDFDSMKIVSSYYGTRYELHFASVHREKAKEWRRAREAREASQEMEREAEASRGAADGQQGDGGARDGV